MLYCITEEQRTKYAYYKVYEGAKSLTENGKYIGKTPIFEQAVGAVEKAREEGKIYFIKAVDNSGKEYTLL